MARGERSVSATVPLATATRNGNNEIIFQIPNDRIVRARFSPNALQYILPVQFYVFVCDFCTAFLILIARSD